MSRGIIAIARVSNCDGKIHLKKRKVAPLLGVDNGGRLAGAGGSRLRRDGYVD